MNIQGTTIEVSNLENSKEFYETLLGFQPGQYYEPTKWLPYKFGEQYFAIREVETLALRGSLDITNFEVEDVEGLWERVKHTTTVAEPLAATPYGTYKFVVTDPDGYRLGFVAAKR